MSVSDLDYYKSQPDYNDIEKYLEFDDIGFIPTFDLPTFKPNYDSAIVIDGTPITTVDKVEKLLSVILKLFVQFSPTLSVNDIYLPIDPTTNETYGFCFIKFPSKKEADMAIESAQGFKMGKNYFKISKYSDLDKYADISDEFIPPPLPDFKPRPDPTDWLCDSLGRDQFALRYGKETDVYWMNTSGEEPSPVYCGEREKANGKTWCENRIAWSPNGSYLATFHPPGIRLCGYNGQEQFHFQGRLPHEEVDDIEFSPCENYAITYRLSPKNPNADPKKAISIWNVFKGENIRNFRLKNPLEPNFQVKASIMEQKKVKDKDKDKESSKIPVLQERTIRGRVISYSPSSNGEGSFTIQEGAEKHSNIAVNKVEPLQEPNRFKWSPDGQYAARVGADMLQVYTLPEMQLLNKESIETKDIIDFSWSPKANLISYWSPVVSNSPATINIIEIPSKKDVCSRKFVDVYECKMIWQSQGDYLCVKMTNKKKVNILVFFRLNDTGVPVEQLEFTDTVTNVAFEPSGDRFTVVLGERNPTISVYSMANAAGGKSVKKEITALFSIAGIQCNDVLWSPAGGVVALAHFSGDNCNFQLHDVDNNLKLAFKSHSRCNRLLWDPSGRFIVSCTITELRNINVRANPEDGYNVYTFQGNQLLSIKKEKLFFFLWRPRPKNLLSADMKKSVVKNLKKYEKMFERDDRLRLEELNKEILASRRKMAEDLMVIVNRNREYQRVNDKLRNARIQARDGFDDDDDSNYIIEVQIVESILETKTK